MSRRIRLGVAGAGVWGRNIVRTAHGLGVLAAVCDADATALAALQSEMPALACFHDFSAMLRAERLDAVAIAVPAALHASLALEAIGAGLAVFVEKPLALDVASAESIVDAARRRGTLLVAGHLLLYDPAVRALLAAVAAGEIGRVRHFRSRRLGWGRLRAHEDVWWSFGPHDVSVMLEAMGEEPVAARRSASAFVRPYVADVTYADFRFSSGRSAHIEVSWIDPERAAQIDVLGSEGVISLVDERNGKRRLTLLPCGDRLSARGEPELWRHAARSIAFGEEAPLRRELASFCQAVEDGVRPPSHADEALAVVRALAMAREGVAPEAVR